MKLLILIASVFSFSTASAKELPTIKLLCTTDYPTTSFIVRTDKDEVTVRMINHNGMKYTPAIAGVFTPNDLKILTERADLVQRLNADMEFRFVRSSCEKGPGYAFWCLGVKEPQIVNGAKVESRYVSVVKTTTEGAGYKVVTYAFRLSLSIDGKDVPIEMPYHEQECAPLP